MKTELNSYERRYLRLLQMGAFERRRGGWRFGTNRIDDRVVDRLIAAGRAVLVDDRVMLPRRGAS